ncbi:1-acyl-sn-glycerol-3-phosphate acyltransferase [Bacteroidales bacterium OttesenSCG-928-I14]|nr:1-acyl-sn-glycerol-3-phosphate acyltransferase [Bacteroidales bacterium OttesenSCG-928-I14]
MAKIQDKNLGYSFLKPIVRLALRLFYRRIQVVGKENIPKDKRIIYAPNHQNALMDALMILYIQPGSTVFLARADIFKKKLIAAILTFLRILPVYRIRDGRDELDKNYEIFEKSVDVLRDDIPLCLMPEGRQSFKRKLLPLVKGMFRIAFQAQSELPDKDIVIVPIGIDYSNYTRPYSDVVVQIGKAIDVRKYMETYQVQQGKALLDLKNEVSAGISSLIQDIQSTSHYEDIYVLSKKEAPDYCNKQGWKRNPYNLLQARKAISTQLDLLDSEDKFPQNYPTKSLPSHEKKGDEFKSSIIFVIFLILLLLLGIAIITTAIIYILNIKH